jgi:hypothetical protein
MFMPNSPRPPRGIAVRVCELLLNEASSPKRVAESYHRAAEVHGLEERAKRGICGGAVLIKASGKLADLPELVLI